MGKTGRYARTEYVINMILRIHPITPERYKIEEAARLVHKGALLLYPTDTGFALGCGLANKSAIERIRRLRKISDKKPLTFLCENLQSIANYAQVSNAAFKAIRKLTPGPYTFILPASRAVPKFVHDEKEKPSVFVFPIVLLQLHCSMLVSLRLFQYLHDLMMMILLPKIILTQPTFSLLLKIMLMLSSNPSGD